LMGREGESKRERANKKRRGTFGFRFVGDDSGDTKEKEKQPSYKKKKEVANRITGERGGQTKRGRGEKIGMAVPGEKGGEKKPFRAVQRWRMGPVHRNQEEVRKHRFLYLSPKAQEATDDGKIGRGKVGQ